MATPDEIKKAIGCLSTVFPQFVSKELANLTDQIASSIQGFTDPLSAIGDISVDSLVDDVASLSEGDVMGNVSEAAAGLAGQYAKREASDLFGAMAEEFPAASKASQSVRNMSGKVATSASMMLSLYPDMPYAAAQRICETLVNLNDLKQQNLKCLRKHIVQLTNCILVIAENPTNFEDETFEDLENASDELAKVKAALAESQRVSDGTTTFDTQAFERARQSLLQASAHLTPDKDGTSILDVADILTSGNVDKGQTARANRALVRLVIPSLSRLIEVEASAVSSQVEVINFHLNSLSGLIDSFRRSANTSRMRDQRTRLIREIRSRVDELCSRIDLAISRGSMRAASTEMLLWSSRVKSTIAMMNRVKDLTLTEGSVEGPDKAAALENSFQGLLSEIGGISNEETVAGVEDPTDLRSKTISLAKAARKILKDYEDGRVRPNALATLHKTAVEVATAQASVIDRSLSVSSQMKTACESFASIDLQIRERYDQLLDSMRELGLDRATDLLSAGKFEEFLDSDLDSLSYLGVAIKCMRDAMNGIDDSQLRKQIAEIRDNLIGRQTNQAIAAVDTASSGRSRLIDQLKGDVSRIQRNAKTVESIVSELKSIAEQIGVNVQDAVAGVSAFAGNLDHLAVGAGGRLAAGLEEFSDHPNAGVVSCDPL